MKKLIHIIGDLLLYFVIMLIIEFVFVKIGWFDRPIVGMAIAMTIGWGIGRATSYLIKKKSKKSNFGTVNYIFEDEEI